MAVDGIGRSGPGGPPGGAPIGGAAPRSPAGVESFSLEKVAPAGSAEGSEALQAVKRGELGLEQYLDQRVTEAVRHLEARLSPDELGFVKQTLREQLSTDPVLMELVRRATGSLPTDTK